jgi:hypothetical protein
MVSPADFLYDVAMQTMTTSVNTRLRYFGITEAIAEEARNTLRDRFGHDLQIETGKAPCRVCLRVPREPERLILLSYQPLADMSPYAEIGPIFVHADRCEPYDLEETFPEDFAPRRLVLRAYGHDGQIVDAVVAEAGTAPEKAALLLSRDDTVEVHVRHESYTCFDFKIARSAG